MSVLPKTLDSFVEKIIRLFLPVVFFLPLYVSSVYYFPFITPRTFVFRIIVGILLGLYIFLLIRNKEKYKPFGKNLLIAYFALGLILTISSFLAGDILYSFWGNYERMEGLVGWYYLIAFLLLILGIYYRRRSWVFLLHVSTLASFIIAFVALSQNLGLDLLLSSAGGERVSSTLGNPTYLAAYSLFHLFFSIYFIVKDKARRLRFELIGFYIMDAILIFIEIRGRSNGQLGVLSMLFRNIYLTLTFLLPQIFLHINYFWHKKSVKWAGISNISYFVLIAIINFLALFNTQTRGAVVGLAVGILFALIFLLSSRYTAKKIRYVIASALLLFILFGVGLFSFKDSNLVKSNPTLERVSHISLTSITVESRILTWQASLKGWQEKPILGWGEEKFYVVFNKYFPTDIFRDLGSQVWFDRPHNVFVQYLVEGGILGLLAYLSIFALAFVNLFKHYRRTKDVKTISIFGGLIIAYLVQNFFVFDSLNTYIPAILLLAVTAFLGAKPRAKVTAMPNRATGRLLVGFAVIVLMVAWSYYANVLKMQANTGFVGIFKELRYSTATSFDEEKNNKLFAIIDGTYLGKFEARQVYSEYAYSLISDQQASYYQQLKTIELAETEMLKSIAEQPDNVRHQSFLINMYLAAASVDPSYAQKNVDLINKAIPLSPTRTQLYYSLGRAYMTLGQADKSVESFKKGLDLSPKVFDSYLNLFAAYLNTNNPTEAEKVLGDLWTNVPVVSVDQYGHLAQVYYVFKYTDKAIDLLKVAIDKYPGESNLYAQLVVYYNDTGDKANAKVYLDKLQVIDPSLAEEAKQALGL